MLTKVSAGVLNIDDLYGFRNRIINGDMRIDQRNAGAAVTTSDSYPVDRFFVGNSTDGAFSAQQDSSAPTGFINSTKITVTTADASVTTTQALQFRHIIEGTNVADLAWGTANAKTVTLSFWVRSSLTGTFGGVFNNSAFNRSYPFTYTISVADTWEYKTITVSGDTSGTWLTTNGTGLNIRFGLGVGPDRSGTAGAWAGASYISATGATSVIGTLNATWYITGVQLEVGTVATPFERRPYGTELALCQRYYQKVFPQASNVQLGAGFNTLTTSSRHVLNFIVEMRIAPTALETSGTAGDYVVNTKDGNIACSAVPSFGSASKSSLYFLNTTTGSLVAGEGSAGRTNGTAAGLNAFLAWSAEL
jgi:hypothetical protein